MDVVPDDNFVTAVIEGRAKPGDVHRWVAEWHITPEDEDDRSLAAFLGMSDQEYSDFVTLANRTKTEEAVLAEIVDVHRKLHEMMEKANGTV